MVEIEVGEYGRTNFGKIIRFAWLESSEGKIHEDKVLLINEDILSSNFYYFHRGERIVKHSKQLIDLIEVGDIVRIRTGLYSSFMEFIDNEECLLILKEQVKKFWTIEGILTKEQYMANCYKGGGE